MSQERIHPERDGKSPEQDFLSIIFAGVRVASNKSRNMKIVNQSQGESGGSKLFGQAVEFERQHGLARMYFSRYALQNGLNLLKTRICTVNSDNGILPLSFENCHLGIIVSGRAQTVSQGDAGIMLDVGTWFIVETTSIPLEVQPLDNLELFTLECNRSILSSLLKQADCQVDQPLSKPLYGSGNGRLRKLSLRIQNCPTYSLTDRLTMEALSLRWLAELLQQPELNRHTVCATTCPTADSAAVMRAARFLSGNLHEAHSIAKLSRRVHLNEFKLKKGFRHLYDSSIFEYLREERMEKAAELLRNQGKNVAEVANQVGYSNPSHFAKAFKEHHGVLPKKFQREQIT